MSEKRDEPNLQALDQASLISIMLEWSQLVRMQASEIQSLKDQRAKNSRNSGKPPSSAGLKKPHRKSLPDTGKHLSGGQKGHPGQTLKMVAKPHQLVSYRLETCPHCHSDLCDKGVSGLEKRPVFDLPPVQIEVTEHQAELKGCAQCGKQVKAGFPETVSQAVPYGENRQAQIAYLSSYPRVPVARLTELRADFYGQSISEGLVLRVVERLAQAVEASISAIQDQVLQAKGAQCDETGRRLACFGPAPLDFLCPAHPTGASRPAKYRTAPPLAGIPGA